MRRSAAAALLSALLTVWACGGSPADLSAASAATGDARTFPTKGGGPLEVKTFVSGLEELRAARAAVSQAAATLTARGERVPAVPIGIYLQSGARMCDAMEIGYLKAALGVRIGATLPSVTASSRASRAAPARCR